MFNNIVYSNILEARFWDVIKCNCTLKATAFLLPYLSEGFEHLCGLVVFALLGHEHHVLDHAHTPLVWRRRSGARESFPSAQHERSAHVIAALARRCPPAARALRAGARLIRALRLLRSHDRARARALTH